MQERPILFSGPMVRAILEDRKLQTRRVCKISARHHEGRPSRDAWEYFRDVPSPFVEYKGKIYAAERDGTLNAPEEFCPYGQPGDRLWVRETFAMEDGAGEYGLSDSAYPKDGRPVKAEDDEGNWLVPWYKATDGEPHIVTEDQDMDDDRTRWKPCIHMPRWASRITLEITEVRVQRLQEISEGDAQAEGVETVLPAKGPGVVRTNHWAKERFADLWDSINGKRPGCDWKANPWTWAVSFKRLKP